MTDRSSPIAQLQEWQQSGAGVSREEMRQLLLGIGYSEERAADYPSVLLYYRAGWPRVSLMTDVPELPVGYLHRLCSNLIPLLVDESTE